MSTYLYNPNFVNEKLIKKKEKYSFKHLINYRKQQKNIEIFLLNNFITNVSKSQNVLAILQKIYGIGLTRAFQFSVNITYYPDSIAFFKLKKTHINLIANLFKEYRFTLKDLLFNFKKVNILNYKKINCYKGIRHSLYLPTRGQRTHSNAHVARYMGSGTFEYVPKRPSTKIKKLSKFSRRKKFLVTASHKRYNRLLNKHFVEYAKNNKRSFKHLVKKNKLGVFAKLFKEKQKMAKLKAKKQKKVTK